MKYWVMVVSLIALPVLSHAESIDPETISLANTVIEKVYQDVQRNTADFRELRNFGPEALNDEGRFKSLEYKYVETDGPNKGRSYEFALTAVPIDERNPYRTGRLAIDIEYPLLGIKLAGYQIKRMSLKQYDIKAALDRIRVPLDDEQQSRNDLKLNILTPKESFQVNEPVTFAVTLSNTGSTSLRVEDLSAGTLNFWLDGVVWRPAGEKDPHALSRAQVLKPGDSLSQTFVMQSYQFPREFNIRTEYIMSYQGVIPYARKTIRILK